MAVKINCLDTTTNECKPCKQAQQPIFITNPGCEQCSPLTSYDCASIDKAICTPILAERIYDAICIEKEENSYLPQVQFTIDGTDSYNLTDPVCIQQIATNYNFVGVEDIPDNYKVFIDGNDYDFDPILKKKCGNINLFRGLKLVLAFDDRCCCIQPEPKSSLARIIEINRQFYVCGLQVTIKGTIGKKPFTATSNIAAGDPHSINEFGFNDITFVGKLCLPTGHLKNVMIHEVFDSCLRAEQVLQRGDISLTGSTYTFDAAVELSFKVNKTISATVQQQLAVFAAAYTMPYHDGGVESTCEQRCFPRP